MTGKPLDFGIGLLNIVLDGYDLAVNRYFTSKLGSPDSVPVWPSNFVLDRAFVRGRSSRCYTLMHVRVVVILLDMHPSALHSNTDTSVA